MKNIWSVFMWIFLCVAIPAAKAQDTLLIFKSGAIVDKVPLLDIDSFAFVNRSVVYDIDSNAYNIITIGTQNWMKQNLRVTTLNDGTPIPLVTDNTEWSGLITPAYSWYNNDFVTYGKTYGALYNWYTVNTEKLCPTGWHVPTSNEWKILYNYVGGYLTAGGILKEAGTAHWLTPNTSATDSVNFKALPAGDRISGGSFYDIGKEVNWWTPSVNGDDAMFLKLGNDFKEIKFIYSNKKYGHSVRCLKNQ